MLTLGAWDIGAVDAYLRAYVGGPVHDTWPEVVHRLGGGSPLYTRELARLLAAQDPAQRRLRLPDQRQSRHRHRGQRRHPPRRNPRPDRLQRTIRLNGTYTSITFTLVQNFTGGSGIDGVHLQVGGTP